MARHLTTKHLTQSFSFTTLQWISHSNLIHAATELMEQALFAVQLEQPRPELPVNFDGTTDHATREAGRIPSS